jgi:sulfonate transport system substrate-binding protein
MPPHPERPKRPTRRQLLAWSVALPAIAALTACSVQATAAGEADPDALKAPLASQVPAGTELVVGDPTTKVALELSGQIDNFTFPIKFANLSGGPQTTEAFRAKALDVGSVADIPPIHATWTGLDVKIVASQYRADAVRFPVYELGIAPQAGISSLADLRGKKIAYSPGQAQGALVLRILEKAGLKQGDVKLVELPSTGDVYPTALAAKQVDAAPLGGVNIKRYLAKYGGEGATTIKHGLRDDPGHLYAPVQVLQDPAKAAALREYVQRWGAAQRWIEDHPKEWRDGYYVRNQNLSAEDGDYLIRAAGKKDIPTSWADAIARHQQTIDLLAREQQKPQFDAHKLYDTRFESIGGTAFAGAAAPAATSAPAAAPPAATTGTRP